MLDLHPQPLAWHVGSVPRLGDHAVKPRSLELLEPLLGRFRVACVRSQKDRLLDTFEQLLEPPAPFAEGLLAQVVRSLREQVEGDEPRRRYLAEHANARLRWMDPLLKRAEVEAVGPHDDQFPIQDELRRTQLPECRQDLGEIPGHRPAAPAHQGNLLPVAEDQRAKAVPLGLVLPAVPLGNARIGDR